MSTDGHQRIVLLRMKKEADLEERALDALADDRASNAASAPRIVTLDYRFGRGHTHAIDFDQLDEVVTLPWTRIKTDAEEAEVRMLGIKAVPAASQIVSTLRKKPRTLSKRMAEACQEDELAEIALETLASDPKELDVDDADVTPARLAQFFMQLRRMLRLAASRKECIGVAIQVELS